MKWMDFKMADTSERRAFCNTILLKYHGYGGVGVQGSAVQNCWTKVNVYEISLCAIKFVNRPK